MLPSGWEIKTIGDIAKVASGGTPSRNIAEYWNGDIPWIKTTEIQNCLILKDGNREYITEKGLKNSSAKMFPKNTILIAMIGEGKTRGQIGLLKFEAATNQNSAAVICKDNQYAEFYYNYLLSQYENIRKNSNSAGQSNLSGSLVKSIPVPVPPLPEQTKIAQILSVWDTAIATSQQCITNSQQQKKALMQQLLTGQKRLAGFSGAWQNHYLNKVAKIIVSPVDKKIEANELQVELCNYTDVYYNTRITKKIVFMKATAKPSEIERFSLQVGDVLITKDSETPGDIAVPALVSESLNNVLCGYHLAIIRPNKIMVDGAYLSYLFSMQKTRYYFFTLATGATRFGLSVGAIENAHFRLPKLEEQQKIAAILSTADREIAALQQQHRHLTLEKKALMQQLLTGKRRVKVDA